jgi:hypothetical protein
MSEYNYPEYNDHAVGETVAQPTPNGHAPEPLDVSAPSNPKASMEKVRDILFGSQTKSNEARFARLEESLAREVFELKDLLQRRVESLESFFYSETQALAERVREEREERMSAFEAHDLEMKGALASLARRLGDLLLKESRRLVEEIGLRHDSVRGLMESRVSELHSRKADRAVISDLMREMAKQLEKDDAEPTE